MTEDLETSVLVVVAQGTGDTREHLKALKLRDEVLQGLICIAEGQPLAGGTLPDLLFLPDGPIAGQPFTETLEGYLKEVSKVIAVLHGPSYGVLYEWLEARVALDARRFTHEGSDPVSAALEKLVQHVGPDSDAAKYQEARQTLIQACRTDWELEAKLAILHALLAPVPPDDGRKVPLTATALLGEGTDSSVKDAAGRFWGVKISNMDETAQRVAEKILDCTEAEKRLSALRALRDALLGSEGG